MKPFTIGRDETCDLVLNSPLVSRFHAQLERGVLQDLDSANGTFVNGKSVSRAELVQSQTVTVGPYHLLFDQGRLQFKGRGLAVSCHGLSWRPPGSNVDLLKNLNLEVPSGTFLALVGTSGAGKSTLMKLLAGLVKPTSGAVCYNHRPRESDEFRRAVGWVPQEEIVHPHLPVQTALEFSARLRLPAGTDDEEIKRRVRYAAEQVSLSHRLSTPILRLSGGEKKRVALAAEELGDPDVFFLDEPTSGLDPGLEKEIMLSLKDLTRRGRTVILVTHATDNIKLCDRLLFLAPGGHPVFWGPPSEATSAFGVEDFAEIYRLLTSPTWFSKQGLTLAQTTRQALTSETQAMEQTAESRRPESVRKPSLWRQFLLLFSRETFLALADRPNMALFALQAPVIALLLGQLFPQTLFDFSQKLDSQAKYPIMEAPTLLFMLVVSSLFFGAINSCRELVKERSIFRREQLLGVRPELYLLAKIVVLGAKGLISVLLLVAGVAALVPLPWDSPSFAHAILLCWATYLGGVGLGLSLSALSGSGEQASTLVTILLIVQLMLSGAFIKPEAMETPIAELSVLSICRWSFAGLCHLSRINPRFSELGLPFVTADYYLTLEMIWSILWPLMLIHLCCPLLFLGVRKNHQG